MDKIIRKGIVEILKSHEKLLRIPLRQKAKFEGWLKFEIANYLEQIDMKNVEVEYKVEYSRNRTDVAFFHNETFYSLELKTPNTNWKIEGVNIMGRPITKNIQSIIADVEKLNSKTRNGIVAFVLFPVPVDDNRWEVYLNRINEKTGAGLNRKDNCELIEINIDSKNICNLVVCTFMSKIPKTGFKKIL